MHHTYFDRFAHTPGALQRISAINKLIIAFTLLVAISSLPQNNYTYPIPYIILLLVVWIISKLPWVYLIRRLLLVLPFVLIAALGIASGISNKIFFTILVKALSAAMCIILLTSTTPFTELLLALRKLKTPDIFISILSFLYRFIFVLTEEKEKLDRARKSRELARKAKLIWRGKAWQMGTLFLKSIEKSEIIYNAMLSRGFKGVPRSINRNINNRIDISLLLAFILVIFLIRIIIYWSS